MTKPTQRKNSEGEQIISIVLTESTQKKLFTLLGIDAESSDAKMQKAQILELIDTQTDLLKYHTEDFNNPLTAANYRASSKSLTKLVNSLITELAETHEDILLAIDMNLAKKDPYSETNQPNNHVNHIQSELIKLKDALALMTEQHNNDSRGRSKNSLEVMVINNLRGIYKQFAINSPTKTTSNLPNALTEYEQREADFIATAMNSVKDDWSVSKIRRIFLNDK